MDINTYLFRSMVQEHEKEHERGNEKVHGNILSIAVLEALSKVKVNGQMVRYLSCYVLVIAIEIGKPVKDINTFTI